MLQWRQEVVGFAEMQVVYSQLQLAGCSRTKVAGFLWKWAELGEGLPLKEELFQQEGSFLRGSLLEG